MLLGLNRGESNRESKTSSLRMYTGRNFEKHSRREPGKILEPFEMVFFRFFVGCLASRFLFEKGFGYNLRTAFSANQVCKTKKERMRW